MRITCELVERSPATFAVCSSLNSDEHRVIGRIAWSKARNQWVADESLLRCLELLTSDLKLRKGLLGTDVERAQEIAMQIAAAWESIASETTKDATLKIPKLDSERAKGTLELFPEYRPLLGLDVRHGS